MYRHPKLLKAGKPYETRISFKDRISGLSKKRKQEIENLLLLPFFLFFSLLFSSFCLVLKKAFRVPFISTDGYVTSI